MLVIHVRCAATLWVDYVSESQAVLSELMVNLDNNIYVGTFPVKLEQECKYICLNKLKLLCEACNLSFTCILCSLCFTLFLVQQGSKPKDWRLPCGYAPKHQHAGSSTSAMQVLVIRPSTMWFTAEPSRLQELVVSPVSGRGLHRVCYSFHSSYSEIRDLVSLLRPGRVFPNVLPASDTSWDQVGADTGRQLRQNCTVLEVFTGSFSVHLSNPCR